MRRVESSVDSIKLLCRRASLTDLTSLVVCVRPPWLLQMLKGAQASLSFQIQKRTKQYLKQICHGLCIHWFSCNMTVSIQLDFSTFYWLLTGTCARVQNKPRCFLCPNIRSHTASPLFLSIVFTEIV